MKLLNQATCKLFVLLPILIILTGLGYRTHAQSMGISSSVITPDASSILEMRTTTKGLLIPRMTTTERDAISSPATGLMLYNTTTSKFNFYNGSSWIALFSGSSGVNSVTGTTNRITIGGTTTDPTVDISSSYAGQSSITTLGTIGTGTWNGSAIGIGYGGTGQTTQQGAINALTGTQSSGTYLRSNGTNASLGAIQAADVPTLNQNTTGSAATLTTSRNIYGNAFDGSANVTGIIASTYGGTGNGFTKFSGPATSEKTYTLPNASATILTDNAVVTAAQGGTGNTSYTVGDLLYASASTTLSKLADVATGNVLISGGTSTAPSYGKVGLTTHVSGTLPIANGGTNSTATPTNGGIVYGDGSAYQVTAAGTAGQVLKSGGSGIPTWEAAATIVILGSDVVNNNASANTMADVTGLSFAVTSGVTYRFHAVLIYTAAATTTGSRWAISGPASPTLLSYTSQYALTATTITTNNATAYDIPAASNATSVATAGNIAIIDGIIKPSANGTVIVRFASEIANSAITAKAGSSLTWW